MFALVRSNVYGNTKRYRVQSYCLTDGVFKNYNVLINKNYDQPIDSDIKRYKDLRKLTTGQGENYTTGCLLDHDYNKNH